MAFSQTMGALLALGVMVVPALGAPALDAPVAQAGQAAQIVPVEPANGAYVVPAVINGVLTEKFIIDSGAADVSIPANIAAQLKQSGTLTGTDLLGSKTYMMADGSKVPSEIYRLASLRIGGMVMENVTVRISAENSHLLLGQSFLSRLKSWSMDNARQVMIFN
jgi:clan AA aspartic protease (TIGR02281 family)